MTRKSIVAGNWKMYKSPEAFQAFNETFIAEISKLQNLHTEVVIIPPFLYLHEQIQYIKGHKNLFTGAQNCHYANEGAFTGEVSPSMLHDIGCKYVIIGHSERRQYFGEDNEFLARKIEAAQKNNLIPIYCCGETLEEREKNLASEVVNKQLTEGLRLYNPDAGELVVAYEPVWAIGTGKTASGDQADQMHKAIRDQLEAIYNTEVAESTPILYGGSVKPANAEALFKKPNIDGGLIGGASLVPEDFLSIIKAI